MLLAIVRGQEWFVVEPSGRTRLEHMDAADEVRLIPVSGGRPTGVNGPIGSFNPAPTRELRQAWREEGTLHVGIELERRANVSPSGCASVFRGAFAWRRMLDVRLRLRCQ